MGREFILDDRIVELWRRLSEPLNVVEDLVANLEADPLVKVFCDLRTDIDDQPTIVDVDTFERVRKKF